jgi:hypothetical protein
MTKWTLIFLLSFQFFLKAQDTDNYWKIDTLNDFNQPHYPFVNSLTMWILKQNFTLDLYQMNIEREIPIANDVDYSQSRMIADVFLPLFKYKSLSSTIGVTYNKSYILADIDNLKKSLHENCYIWLPIQYQFKKMKIVTIYENFLYGDNNSLYSQISNMQRVFLTVVYPFNTKWHLMLMGFYMYKKLEKEHEHTSLPSFQLRYQPNKKLQMVAGAPILFAVDWQFLPGLDFSFSQFLMDETDAFIRFNISKNIGLSFHYLSTNYSNSDIFFKQETIMLNNAHVAYNNLTQYQDAISLKLGVKTFKDIGLIFSGGYNLGKEISLYNERILKGKTNGANEFFFGLSLQYMAFK